MAHVDENGDVKLDLSDRIGVGLAAAAGWWLMFRSILIDSVGLFLLSLLVMCSDMVIIKIIVKLEKRERGAAR